ncbi:F-box only protein 7-like [Lycorma delicatula]|uniref:F-box only protein 7-like n=1 Tax=Lycorma delicatula TaxID=130591 RepID=UPI003F5197F0
MDIPLMVCESQESCVPESLERNIRSIEDHVGIPTRNQLIAGLFYVLMQECGYILMQPSVCEKTSAEVSEVFKGSEQRMVTFNLPRLLSQASLVSPLLTSSSGIYTLPFKLFGIQNYNFKLLVIPFAEDLIVLNLLVAKEDFNECFSMVLEVCTFVPKPKAVNVADKFSDLKTLSIIFKDNIAHKGRCAVLNAEGLVNNSLIGLMDEVKQKIIKSLSVEDLLNLSATCHSMLSLKQDVSVWKALLWRDFQYQIPEEEEQSAENLMKIYKRLRHKPSAYPQRFNNNEDLPYDYSFDFDSDLETPILSRNSSVDFHPYFIPMTFKLHSRKNNPPLTVDQDQKHQIEHD